MPVPQERPHHWTDGVLGLVPSASKTQPPFHTLADLATPAPLAGKTVPWICSFSSQQPEEEVSLCIISILQLGKLRFREVRDSPRLPAGEWQSRDLNPGRLARLRWAYKWRGSSGRGEACQAWPRPHSLQGRVRVLLRDPFVSVNPCAPGSPENMGVTAVPS